MESSAKKFFEDVKELIEKAIGTSSSVDQERDERSVENYVRDGGNIVSNTTEPDPQGGIAVTKSYPDAKTDSKHVIGSATNPNGDIAVEDSPEGPTPTQETIPSDATSAITPTQEDMAEASEESIEKGANCPSCGQAMPVAKSDDSDEDDLMKAVDEKETAEEVASETPADEMAEMKKSLWGGAFAPVN
jgi:hypothetical protein